MVTDERCRSCDQPMVRRGAALYCSSGSVSHPVRVFMPNHTRGELFNAKCVERDEALDGRFVDHWSQFGAR